VFAPAGGPRAGAFYSSAHEAFFLPPAQPPRISDGGIVSAAGGHPAIAPGSLASLYGSGLAPGGQRAVRWPLPTQMNAVSVKVNSIPAPLLFVSPEQINFLLPFETRAPLSLVVTYAGSDSAPAQANPDNFRSDSAPAIFTVTAEGQAAAVIAGTGLIAGAARDSLSRPARRGEVLELYCTGLGQVSNPPAAGSPAPADPPAVTSGTTIVTVGSARAEVLFSGLAPGFAGLYQINTRIPADAPAGNRVPVSIKVNETGLPSNTAAIAIQ
jgi:uncharacterized protein (TIGR03437 family)